VRVRDGLPQHQGLVHLVLRSSCQQACSGSKGQGTTKENSQLTPSLSSTRH
jgi:hypothetical protein